MSNEVLATFPIWWLGIASLILLLVDGIWKNRKLNFDLTFVSLLIAFIGIAYDLVFFQNFKPFQPEQLVSKGMLSFEGFSYFFDLIFVLAGLLVLLAGRSYISREYKELNEFYSLIVLAVFGMSIIGHSNNLLVLFLGIETMSLSFYVLAGFFRVSDESVEASLKYFLLGAFATGFLVYGIALVYGAAKTLMINEISIAIQNNNFNRTYFTIGFGLILVGLSFKIAAFPFHQWAADVYSGSPTVVAGFLSTAGKSAGVLAFLIVTKAFLVNVSGFEFLRAFIENSQMIIAIISAITMLVGNFIALVQKNVKRMLAYSSIAHAGYLLMGIVANNVQGWNGLLFYSVAYLFMQLGAFIIVSMNERQGEDTNSIESYAGYSKKHPFIAATLSVFMLSLAGIPPLAGFVGKYYLFVAAIKSGFVWLTIVAVISSIISMYYYIGLILVMYFKEQAEEKLQPAMGLPLLSVVICLIAIILFGVFPNIIVDFAINLFG